MSPLIIVGILISTALADVSHVVSGAAHPPANPVEVNSLATYRNAFQSGNPNDFWWMASNSPLKEAYEYFKKCSSKGDCVPPLNAVPGVQLAEAHFDPIDLKKNPFLNGEFQSGAVSASSSFSSSSSSGCSSCSGGSKSGDVAAFHSGAKIDINNNPFLNGQFATAGVQPKKPGFATSHPLTNKKPFATSPPNRPQSFVLGGEVSAVECRGQGYLCVAKDLCVDGTFNRTQELHQVKNDAQFCNINTQVCCRLTNGASSATLSKPGKTSFASTINNLADISAAKSSVTGSSFKFFGGAGLSPGQIQVLIDQPDDVKVTHNGESGSASTNKATRDITSSATSVFPSTVDYSGIQFSNDIRFASTIKGPAYLPPIGPSNPPSSTPELLVPTQPSIVTYQPSVPTTPRPTIRTCPPGTFFTSSGICETPNTPIPPCPFGTIRTPDGNCERPIISPSPTPCPPGTILAASGSCEAPPTPALSCPFGTILTADGNCARPSPPPTAQPTPRPCPPGTFLSASGLCERPRTPAPTPACPFGTKQRADGTCERPTPQPTPRPCPPGTFLSASGLCERPRTPAPTPACPFGTIQRADGTCERPTPQPTPRPCPPGTFLSASGICERPRTPAPTPACPFGTIQRADGTCEKLTPPSTPRVCPFGTLYDGSCASPTPPPTPKQCPAGTFLTASGICEKPRPITTPLPCPYGTILTASGLCEATVTPTPRPSCPSGTILSSSGRCEQPPCPPGTTRTLSGLCERLVVTTARPQCTPGTYLSASGICEALSTPKPPPRPFETTTASREYLPPLTTQPSNPSNGYHYETPTPTFGYPSTPNQNPDANSINNYYVPAPTTPKYLPPHENEGYDIQNAFSPGRNNTDSTGSSNNLNPSILPTTRRPPQFVPEQNNEPPVGCAAALKCVQEIYCTAEGVVSPVPVVLTKEQELLRVPTTECREEETGILGKCCRDPNYKDPWPSANLVNGVDDGQYKEDNFYGQRELLATNRLTRSSNATKTGVRGNEGFSNQNSQEICGERHQSTKPLGPGPIDAHFAEYPWQAMILRDSNRSLLCGGAIIRRNAVLTAAHCVDGLDTSDVLIKGGEWKLGIDEEPLPFQIVKVGAILRHPDYVPGSYKNDIAILVLRENLRHSKNIGTICLSDSKQVSTGNCVATGWGKRILQLHAKGAIMHHINVDVLDGQQCQETLQQNFQISIENYSPNTLCGVSQVDQCKVDYGSALACSNGEGQFTLAGIYSWDTGCKQEGQIGGYVTPDVAWIETTLAKPIKELKKIEREYLLKSY